MKSTKTITTPSSGGRRTKIKSILPTYDTGHYYDRDGKMIDMMAWAELFENREYKIIEQTRMKDGKSVSTVWLGLDHRFGDKVKPLIFETMVFPKKNDWSDLDMGRYSTLAQAKAGHKKMVKKYS